MRLYCFLISYLFLMLSCEKEKSTSISEGMAQLSPQLVGVEFQDTNEINLKSASVNFDHNESLVNDIQHEIIPWGNGQSLSIELAANNNNLKKNLNKQSAIERTSIEEDVQYKLLVYKLTGEYVDERDYIHKKESLTPPLSLKAGETYIFIAYSFNSKSPLPAVDYINPANKTLQTATLTGINGNNRLMYFKNSITIISNQTNYLSIILKHQFSEITTQIDASKTGYNITSVAGNFGPHYNTANFSLENGTITTTGSAQNQSINFNNINSPIVNGATIRVNTGNASTRIILTGLTIEPTVKSNVTILNNFIVRPGVKYTLKITANPTDSLFIHNGIPVVSIAGKVWMRHNLGAPRNLDPDNNITTDIIGNYYKFGLKDPVANGNTSNTAITNWNTTNSGAKNSWNSGTINAPSKTNNDPCDNGFRIPTKPEYDNLLAATMVNRAGTLASPNYSLVLTSKINKNVRLTFPIAGFREIADGGLSARGSQAYYWTNHYYTTPPAQTRPIANFRITNNESTTEYGAAIGNYGYGELLKCVRQ